MHCQVRSADQVLFEGEAIRVVARSSEGEFAVMDNHAPLLATLPAGPLRIVTNEETSTYACLGGVLRVEENTISISCRRAIHSSEIELSSVEDRLQTIEQLAADALDPAQAQERDDLLVLREVGRNDG